MKKLFLALISLVLVIAMVSPVLAASPRILNTWVHTSQGLLPAYPTGWAFAFLPNYRSDGQGVAFVGTSSQGVTSGIFKSTNSGVNWSGTAQMNATLSLAVSPNYASDHLMVAGTASDGVWMTTDEWVTPTDITGDITDLAINGVAFSPNYAIDHQLFAGTVSKGVFITVNQGTSWTHVGPGAAPDDSRITGIVFTPDYASSHTLFIAASHEGSDVNGVYQGVWNLAGTQILWTQLITGLTDLDIRALVISPNYVKDHILFVGTFAGGLFKSASSGSSWSFISGTENLYVQALAISPDYFTDRAVYMGEDGGGVYRYFDSPASPAVTQMNAGFPDLLDGGSITALAFAPGNPRVLFGGELGDPDVGGVWQFLFPTKMFIPFGRK